MEVERTIEFLLKEAARNEERWAKSDARLSRLERVVAQNSRVVTRMVQYGVSLRSEVRRLDKAMTRMAEVQSETGGKLNALIDLLDKMIRRNGTSGNRRKIN